MHLNWQADSVQIYHGQADQFLLTLLCQYNVAANQAPMCLKCICRELRLRMANVNRIANNPKCNAGGPCARVCACKAQKGDFLSFFSCLSLPCFSDGSARYVLRRHDLATSLDYKTSNWRAIAPCFTNVMWERAREIDHERETGRRSVLLCFLTFQILLVVVTNVNYVINKLISRVIIAKLG